MNDAHLMSLGEAFGNLDGDRNNGAHGGDAGGKQFTQSLSFDELQYQKVSTFMVPDVVEGADIGVGEFGDSARFMLEAAAKIDILRKVLGKDLDGDNAAQAAVASAIHFAHATGAEWSEDLVGAYMGAWSEGHSGANYNLTRTFKVPSAA